MLFDDLHSLWFGFTGTRIWVSTPDIEKRVLTFRLFLSFLHYGLVSFVHYPLVYIINPDSTSHAPACHYQLQLDRLVLDRLFLFVS